MTRHLLQISDLSLEEIQAIIEMTIKYFYTSENQKIKKISNNKILITFFLEPSTRTMLSFNIAAAKLGITIVNLSQEKSSLKKGETIEETLQTINSMKPNFLILRADDTCLSIESIQRYLQFYNFSLINAGIGITEHPTQALLDLAVIVNNFNINLKEKHALKNIKIAICGDIKHSRVARSNIKLFSMLGAEITLISPPEFTLNIQELITTSHNITTLNQMSRETLAKQDIIIMLRIQKERHQEDNDTYTSKEHRQSTEDKISDYCLTKHKTSFLKPNAIIMHPGPLNVGTEIELAVLEDKRNKIHEQITMGVCLRQSILQYFIENNFDT